MYIGLIIWDLPKIPKHGLLRIESCTHWNIHRLPHGKSTNSSAGLGKGKMAHSKQPHILGRIGLSSHGWLPVLEKDNYLKPLSARFAGQTQQVKTLGPWTCLSIQKPCPSHGSTAPVPLRKVLEPEARRGTLTENLQLRWCHSHLSPLRHSGETLSLKSGIGACKLMPTISI